MKRGCLIVVSGASGTGKGTVCNTFLEIYKWKGKFIIIILKLAI